MHTIEVFCAIDPEDGREFLAVITWFRQEKGKKPFPISQANFYAETAKEAREKADGWIMAEQAKAAKREKDANDRAEALAKARASRSAAA